MDTKHCPTCDRDLPLSEFYVVQGRPYTYCKACKIAKNTARARGLAARPPVAPPTEKRCATCGEVKPASAFSRDKSKKDGLYNSCKACDSKRHAVFTASHTDYLRRYERTQERKIAKAALKKEERQRDPIKMRMRNQMAQARIRAAAYNAPPSGSRSAELLLLYDAFGYRCVYCDKPFADAGDPTLTIDHFVPLARGGTNDLNNIVPACHSCNMRKNDILPEDFVDSYKRLQHICETLSLLTGITP